MAEPLILGIETSCDETGIGIVRGEELLANAVASSMDEHIRFGGVVPEVASRAHLQALRPTLAQALATADVDLSQIDGIAVTAGPGLMGALAVGIAFAKSLAWATGKPLWGVNHLAGHVTVDILDHGPLPESVMALLVSGGHTSLLRVDDHGQQIASVGSTIDDAAGEAYDKVARVLGLPYPGGPAIDAAAAFGDPRAIRFPRGLTSRRDLERHRFDFSFSGLKTSVARWVETAELDHQVVPVDDVAASFQESVADVLTAKAMDACNAEGIDTLVIGGGVAANSRLRSLLAERAETAGVTVRRPAPALCTDNGAMIAAVGVGLARRDAAPSQPDFGANPGLPVTTIVA